MSIQVLCRYGNSSIIVKYYIIFGGMIDCKCDSIEGCEWSRPVVEVWKDWTCKLWWSDPQNKRSRMNWWFGLFIIFLLLKIVYIIVVVFDKKYWCFDGSECIFMFVHEGGMYGGKCILAKWENVCLCRERYTSKALMFVLKHAVLFQS